MSSVAAWRHSKLIKHIHMFISNNKWIAHNISSMADIYSMRLNNCIRFVVVVIFTVAAIKIIELLFCSSCSFVSHSHKQTHVHVRMNDKIIKIDTQTQKYPTTRTLKSTISFYCECWFLFFCLACLVIVVWHNTIQITEKLKKINTKHNTTQHNATWKHVLLAKERTIKTIKIR